ncbi:MAG: class I tRNA ligase family protein, partial [Dehalococcoidia bacterium]|nr:class I tRNA ligase family protein [Dehalococcoidia bacterium]
MLSVYNTLTKRIAEVQPIKPGFLSMYTCGPTVYRDAHIGNLRTYLMADWIRRIAEANGLEVYHVKNITDVGHMRQELVETGGDKVILAAIAEGRTVQDITKYYADIFHRDEARLNIKDAHVFPWATEHITEMVYIVEKLISNGYAYERNGNVYYDVGK